MKLYIPRFIAFLMLLFSISASIGLVRVFGADQFIIGSIGLLVPLNAITYYISRY